MQIQMPVIQMLKSDRSDLTPQIREGAKTSIETANLAVPMFAFPLLYVHYPRGVARKSSSTPVYNKEWVIDGIRHRNAWCDNVLTGIQYARFQFTTFAYYRLVPFCYDDLIPRDDGFQHDDSVFVDERA